MARIQFAAMVLGLCGSATAAPLGDANGPTARRVSQYETALIQDMEMGPVNFGASTETKIRLSRARVRALRCAPTAPGRVHCTYLTDWCSGGEPLEGEFCRRIHGFTRRDDGLWMMDDWPEVRERGL